MKTEKEIRNNLENSNEEWLNGLEDYLRSHDYIPINLLRHFIANLCDINEADMLSSLDSSELSQARWLYWYAFRYMTHDSFMRVAERTEFEGHRYSWRAVAKGITRMGEMIEQDNIWAKRWLVVKRFIKIKNENDTPQDEDAKAYTITLVASKGNVQVNAKEIKK